VKGALRDDGSGDLGLWRSDGSEEGTVRIDPEGLSLALLGNSLVIGRTVFFTAGDGGTGAELWKSDGTESGTVLVKDINPGPGSSTPSALTDVNERLVFQACEPARGCEVWESDGTAEGTRPLADIVPGSYSSSPEGFAASRSLLNACCVN
jgi:ELWxxDGT repeat protein